MREALYSGLVIPTCIGLFLFTRILIPDVILTLTVAVSLWAFLRVLEEEEPHPKRWAAICGRFYRCGPLAQKSHWCGVSGRGRTGLSFLHKAIVRSAHWRRLSALFRGIDRALDRRSLAILATLRNPPYFVFTMRSAPGEYHGFFWFYFFNEQLLRFLNMRYPRDYDTVPRHLFWLFHLLWLFPWSVYLAGCRPLTVQTLLDRAGKTRLLALCWIGFVMVFFTFSTTQEYYSMPIYPAVALCLVARWSRAAAGFATARAFFAFLLVWPR